MKDKKYTKEEREQYEQELSERQAEHFKQIVERQEEKWQPCLHDGCEQCHGTGRKADGSACFHYISCPCPRCNPFSMIVDYKKEPYTNMWSGHSNSKKLFNCSLP